MNARVCFIGLVLGLALTDSTHAQDSATYSTLSFGVGLQAISNNDAFQSLYTYRGASLAFNSTYRSLRTKGHHIIDLTYSDGEIRSIVSPKADNQLLILNYDYLFKLKTKRINRRTTSLLGVGLHTLLSSTNYLPEVESPKSYLSGSAFVVLGANILYRINEKNRIRLQSALPVLGLVYRPDFEINGKTLTAITSVWNSNFLSIKLEYSYTLTRKLHLRATYNYNYFTFGEPRRITLLQNAGLIGLVKKF